MIENFNEGYKYFCFFKVRFVFFVWYFGDFLKIFDRRKNSWIKDINSKFVGFEIKRLNRFFRE